MGLFFMVLGTFPSVKGNLNATAYNEIVAILCFQLCGNSLGEALSCFSMTMPLSTKRFAEIGVEELDWLAQSPDFNPVDHLWDELKRRL